MKPTHRIADLHLELCFESDDPRPQAMAEDDLLALAREHILSALAEALEQEDDGRQRRIARLDIDLGECAAHDYAAEIPPLLARLLREALARHDSEAAGATHAPSAAGKREPLEYFLLTGFVPSVPFIAAGEASRHRHERLLAPWLASTSTDGELKTLLRRCVTSPDAVRRLAQQFDSVSLRQLVRRVEAPANAAIWLSLINEIDAALPLADASTRQDLRQFWEILLAQILGGATGTAPVSVSTTLRGAAVAVSSGAAANSPQAAALLRSIAMDPKGTPAVPVRSPEPPVRSSEPPVRDLQPSGPAPADVHSAPGDRYPLPDAADAAPEKRYFAPIADVSSETLWTEIEQHIAAVAGEGAELMLNAIRAGAARSADRHAFFMRVAEALRQDEPVDLEEIEASIAAAPGGHDRQADITPTTVKHRQPGIAEPVFTATSAPAEQPGQVGLSKVIQLIPTGNAEQASRLRQAPAASNEARVRWALAPSLTIVEALRKIGVHRASRSPTRKAAIRVTPSREHDRQDQRRLTNHRLPDPLGEPFRPVGPADSGRVIVPFATAASARQSSILEQALLDADVARVSSALVEASSPTVLAAMWQIGARPEVWRRIAHFPPTLLLQLTWAAAPQATNILLALQPDGAGTLDARANTDTSDAVLNDPLLWQRCLLSLASTPFEAVAFREALREPPPANASAPTPPSPHTRHVPPAASVPKPPTAPIAIRATGAPVEHVQPHFYLPPNSASRRSGPEEKTGSGPIILKSSATGDAEQSAVLRQALLTADEARVGAALAAASRQTVLEAIRQIGASPGAWLRVANFAPALLMRLIGMAAPQAQTVLLTLQSAEGGATQAPATSVASGDALNDPLFWQRCLTYLASTPFDRGTFHDALQVPARANAVPPPAPAASSSQPGARVPTPQSEPISSRAAPAPSADDQADPHQPPTAPSNATGLAAESGNASLPEALWREVTAMIAAQSAGTPDAGRPSLLARAVQSRAAESHDTEAFLQMVLVALRNQQLLDLDDIEEQIQSQVDPVTEDIETADASSLLRRIEQQLAASAGTASHRMMEAISVHAESSPAPAAYLEHVLEDIMESRPIDLEELDMLYDQPAASRPTRPTRNATTFVRQPKQLTTTTFGTAEPQAKEDVPLAHPLMAASPPKPTPTPTLSTPASVTTTAHAAGPTTAKALATVKNPFAAAANSTLASAAGAVHAATAATADAAADASAAAAAADAATAAAADAAAATNAAAAYAADATAAADAATTAADTAAAPNTANAADATTAARTDTATAAAAHAPTPANAENVADATAAVAAADDAAATNAESVADAAAAMAAPTDEATAAAADAAAPASAENVADATAAVAAADEATAAATDTAAPANAEKVANATAAVAAAADEASAAAVYAPDVATTTAVTAVAADAAVTAVKTKAHTEDEPASQTASSLSAIAPISQTSVSAPASASPPMTLSTGATAATQATQAISTSTSTSTGPASTPWTSKTEIVELHPSYPRRAPGGELARALARHVPARRAALTALLRDTGDDIGQLTPATIHNVVKLLAGSDAQIIARYARDVGALAAQHLPHLPTTRLEFETAQFDLDWFFIQGKDFVPAAYAHALTAWLSRDAAGAAAPLHEALHSRLGIARPTEMPRPAVSTSGANTTTSNGWRTTASATDQAYPDLQIDALIVDNAGQVLIGPYMPRLFSMLGLTEAGQFKNAEAAERAVHLLQCVVGGPSDTPEAMLGLNKILCGVPAATAIALEITITDQERDTVEMMLRAIIEHWKKIGNTTPDGLRQSFLRRTGRMHLKDDAWYLDVDPGTFDMLLDSLPWSFSIIKHPWMERAVHVNWR